MATGTGQTINDRLNAVRYALVGQGLARTVCKATTEEVLGPKKKHIDYLLACTNEPNVSIPQLANLLIERTQNSSWAVVFKALTTIHQLMNTGNERFTQYLATSNHSFELNDFMDRTTPQGYNMSAFVRKYAKYINDKSISYRTLAIDLCKIRSGNDNALRTMNLENLSKTLPIVQQQFDSLLDFGAEAKDLNNGVIMSAFKLLYKDLVRLYVAYQEAIINLLERYFKLSRKKTREALEMYKNYLARIEKIAGFLLVVDAVGLDKSEMPDLKKPGTILKVLEQHLAQLEAKKRGGTPANLEAGGDGDDECEASDAKEETKENQPPASSPVAPAKPQQPAPSTPGSSGEPTETSSSSAASSKPAPPKPARPSPKVSPKNSPSSSSVAPRKAASPVPPPHPAPPAASDKKPGPPSRPAKPPSRPPPPSASFAPELEKAAKEATGNSTSSVSPVPPPHPPPPTSVASYPSPSRSPPAAPRCTPAAGSTETSASTSHTTEQTNETSGLTNGSSATNGVADSNGDSSDQQAEQESEVVAEETTHDQQAVDEQQQSRDEIEMPPPPPPIEDEEPEASQVAQEADGGAALAQVADAEAVASSQDNGRVAVNGGQHQNGDEGGQQAGGESNGNE